MIPSPPPLRRGRLAILLLGALLCSMVLVRRADHGDTPLLTSLARHDARITDLYAFERGGNLVLALCVDPTVAPDVSSYAFPSDLHLRVMIDNDSPVDFGDPDDLAELGGTVLDPHRIREDVVLDVTFRKGEPVLNTVGLRAPFRNQVQVFTGLRDDPFIRGPRIGRNVAAVVLELPLEAVVEEQSTLLIWGTSKVPGLRGPFQELAGRALRNQFPENDEMNTMHPCLHEKRTGKVADVIVYDTARAASYPNGRELADDVVDLVGDPRPLANDEPFPSENDVPFLTTFPYLAPPQ